MSSYLWELRAVLEEGRRLGYSCQILASGAVRYTRPDGSLAFRIIPSTEDAADLLALVEDIFGVKKPQ